MSLSQEIYQQFEDVVGPEYISNDPGIMPAYFNYFRWGFYLFSAVEIPFIIWLSQRFFAPERLLEFTIPVVFQRITTQDTFTAGSNHILWIRTW